MTDSETRTDPSPLDGWAGRLRLGLLVALALSAIGLLAARGPLEDPPPDPFHTAVAIGLALANIVTRALASSPRLEAGARAWLWIASLACAAGLGGLAWIVVLRMNAPTTGLVYTLAAAIFSLRRPTVVPAR